MECTSLGHSSATSLPYSSPRRCNLVRDTIVPDLAHIAVGTPLLVVLTGAGTLTSSPCVIVRDRGRGLDAPLGTPTLDASCSSAWTPSETRRTVDLIVVCVVFDLAIAWRRHSPARQVKRSGEGECGEDRDSESDAVGHCVVARCDAKDVGTAG